MSSFLIRGEVPADHRAAEHLVRDAFWNYYVPGASEHCLLHQIRRSPDFLQELALLAEKDGRPAGCLYGMRGHVQYDDGTALPVVTLGPLAVRPSDWDCGLGSALLQEALRRASAAGEAAVFLCGDPAYYTRRGFTPAEDFCIRAANGCYMAGLLARALIPGALCRQPGVYRESPDYAVDPAAAEAFDQTFPPKEKISGILQQRRFQEVLGMVRKA